jgi:hypothetical protein
LKQAEATIEMLKEKLRQKDEYVQMLREQVQLLSSMRSLVPLQELPPRQSSLTPQVSTTPEEKEIPPAFDNNSDDTVIPSSYANIAASKSPTPKILRRSVTPVSAPDNRAKLQKKFDLVTVYFVGLHQGKLRDFRKHAKQLGLSLQSVRNVSLIGSSIAELIVDSNALQSFIQHAKAVGFQVKLDIDITDKNRSNPILAEYPGSNSSLSDIIKSNFVRRVSHEIKSAADLQVRQYYLHWADLLGWKDCLLIDSTGLPSI